MPHRLTTPALLLLLLVPVGCSMRVHSAALPSAPPPLLVPVPPEVHVEAEPPPPELPPKVRYDPLILEYAGRFDVEPALVKAVIRAESNFDCDAISRRGARGLMQLMPRTAHAYGAHDLHDPRENIRAGVLHLRKLLDRFKSMRLAIAAYNAGARAVRRHRGLPPYRETRRYVQRVLQFRAMYRRMD